jgi:large subunit ribosomal protein L6
MSRIGKKPIPVPSAAKISINASTRQIDIEGPKGKLSFVHRPEVTVTWDEDEKQVVCAIPENKMNLGQMRAYWGTTRSIIQNMIQGVSEGYEKKLEIIGVGWNAQKQGQGIRLNIGFCHPVDLEPPKGVEVNVDGPRVIITGPDKQAVGQFAAVIRSKRKPEPYNGKGIKYMDEIIIRKQGKVFGA